MAKRPPLHTMLALFEDETSEHTKQWIESACAEKRLTRKSFFEAAYWAILVANRNVVIAQSWADKASATGFPFSWRKLGDWNEDDGKFDEWCKQMAGQLETPKDDLDGGFRNRWWGIWDIGWRLAQFQSDAAFRKRYFDGKKRGSELTDEDFHRLRAIKRTDGALYQIGEVSMYFILRNLGGDFLKPDTWIKAFAEWYGCASVSELASVLRSHGIHCGKFDGYCWEYCESHLRRASDLPRHFDKLPLVKN